MGEYGRDALNSPVDDSSDVEMGRDMVSSSISDVKEYTEDILRQFAGHSSDRPTRVIVDSAGNVKCN